MILLFLLSFSILPIILTFLEILFVKKILSIKNIMYIHSLKYMIQREIRKLWTE